MRLRIKIGVVAGVGAMALATAVALAGPAAAKGEMPSGTISGPGLEEPIEVSLEEPMRVSLGEGNDLWARLWRYTLPDAGPRLVARTAPTNELGPRYTLTWEVVAERGKGRPIVQHLYPLAAGGPAVHTLPHQTIWGAATPGGWWQPPSGILDTLTDAGVPLAGATPSAAQPPASPGDPMWPETLAGVGGGLALAGVGAALAVRRVRARRRVAPIPL